MKKSKHALRRHLCNKKSRSGREPSTEMKTAGHNAHDLYRKPYDHIYMSSYSRGMLHNYFWEV
jgi:hypothetical protein